MIFARRIAAVDQTILVTRLRSAEAVLFDDPVRLIKSDPNLHSKNVRRFRELGQNAKYFFEFLGVC